jgi:[acyl-carrier-protein] S-malonyltransferase
MLAFTFPGQGSQQPAMGAPWIAHPSWALVDAASEATGRDVAHLLLHADAEELRRTENAQLCTHVLSLVVHDAVTRAGLRPGVVAGHSLGEYSALVAAGALGAGDAVRLVAERGAAMQAAADARPGTMAAVLGADDDAVAQACERAGGEVWVANHNGAGQVVIAGDAEAITAAGAIAKELGARKVLPLPVGGAFHTPFMAPAADRLRAALDAAAWSEPAVPVVANVDARPHREAGVWPDLLHAQLTAPVRWRQSVEAMVAEGVTTFLELGPGNVLTGVAKRAAKGATALAVGSPEDLDAAAKAAGSDATEPATQPATEPATEPATQPEAEPTPEPATDGEHLFAAERLVVSPAAGLFEPAGLAPGALIERGHVVGRVAGQEIRSPFHGAVMGLLAVAGERLTRSQPVAWLRTA